MADDPGTEFEAYWRRTLVDNDRAAHAGEVDRALGLEVEGLRARCAELSAALTQARAAIMVRHELLKAQTAALAERDTALAAARSEARSAKEAYERVVTSRRWRVFDVAARAAAGGRALLARRGQA